MEIDISSGGWRRRASTFDGCDGRRWVLSFDGGNGWQLWQRWMIEMATKLNLLSLVNIFFLGHLTRHCI